jgi:hypothetical protein
MNSRTQGLEWFGPSERNTLHPLWVVLPESLSVSLCSSVRLLRPSEKPWVRFPSVLPYRVCALPFIARGGGGCVHEAREKCRDLLLFLAWFHRICKMIINAVIVDPGFNIALNIDSRTDIRWKKKYNWVRSEKDWYSCIQGKMKIFLIKPHSPSPASEQHKHLGGHYGQLCGATELALANT